MREPFGEDDVSLRAYLLGTLPEDARAALERRVLGDEPAFEHLLALEDELYCEYAQRGLAPEEARAFEERFLGSAEGRQRLERARALLAGLEPARRPRASLLRQVLLPAAAVLALAAGIWRAWPGADVLRPPPSPPPPAGTPQPSRTPEPEVVVTVPLTPGVEREGGGVPQVVLERGATRLRLVLRLPAGVKHARGRAELRTADGVPVWTADALALTAGSRTLTLELPAAPLIEGDYLLLLFGEAGAGRLEELADYRVTLLRD